MKRVLLVIALTVATSLGASAQQATGKTMPGVVSIVVESPADSSQLRPFVETMRQNPGSEQAAEAHLAVAKLHYNNRAYHAALEDLRRIGRGYPRGGHSEETAYYLIATLLQTFNYEETIAEATNALSLNPANRWNDSERYFLGRAYEAMGQTGSALVELNSVVENHPNSPHRDDALLLIANLQKDSKQYDLAIASLRRIVAESRDKSRRSEARLQIAWLYSAKGDVETAVAGYREAAANDASVAGRAGYETAYIYLNRGDYENSLNIFREVAERYPEDAYGAQASYRVGYCLAELGAYESALKELEKTDVAYPSLEQRDFLLWYEAICHRGLDQQEIGQLVSRAYRAADTAKPKTELRNYLLWYLSTLENRLGHLGQTKRVLQELLSRYRESSLVKVSEEMLTQTVNDIQAVEADKARAESDIKQLETESTEN